MPQIFKIGSFWVYFWSNEGVPLEPVHVHESEVISVCKDSLLTKKCKPECPAFLCMYAEKHARRTAQNQTCLILFLFSKPFCIFCKLQIRANQSEIPTGSNREPPQGLCCS